jgi:putative heme-binding domain-containing protein
MARDRDNVALVHSMKIDTLRIAPLILMLLWARPALTQHATGADVLAGEQAFQSYCATCHGRAGNQIANVDLGHGVFRKPYDDAELTNIVIAGIPGTAMPATAGMTREQAVRIVAYLRSRAVTRDAAAGGDAARGRVLFETRGQCLTCHRVGSSGSRLGPDLTRIGLLRTSDHLATSLLEPEREVQPTNRSFSVTTRSGEIITGRLLNQDVYSVQMLDSSERLRSLPKTELAHLGFVPSPMPSVRGTFDEGELADIVRYLGTLQGAGS